MITCPTCQSSLEKKPLYYTCHSCVKAFPIIEKIPSFIPSDLKVEGYSEEFFEMFYKTSDRAHFWCRARSEIIFSVLSQFVTDVGKIKFLEVGCGTGVVMEYLQKQGMNVEGVDVFQNALHVCRERLGANVWLADARQLPFCEEFDCIGLFDCLEHIEEEKKVLSSLRKALKPGGLLLLTVPAEPSLWTDLDKEMGHYRRYTKEKLRSRLEEEGFKVVKISHFNCLLFPIYKLHRFWSHFSKASFKEAFQVPPGWINTLFYKIMRSEKKILRKFNFPYGSSLIALAHR